MDTVDLPRIEALRACLRAERNEAARERALHLRVIESQRRTIEVLRERVQELEGRE